MHISNGASPVPHTYCSYAHLHGKHVVHPVNGRRIPIICDAELVDMSFGTGKVNHWLVLYDLSVRV